MKVKPKFKVKWEGSSDRMYTDLFRQTKQIGENSDEHNFSLSQRHTMCTKYPKVILDFF